jgi:multicomponent Na+:H+ antiporter subunit C
MIVYLLCFRSFSGGPLRGDHPEKPDQDCHLAFIMEFSIFLILVLIGYIDQGLAPIVEPGSGAQVYVDPLPQAMVLTAIVIGLATTAMLMAIAIRLYRKYKTFDIREIKNLRG